MSVLCVLTGEALRAPESINEEEIQFLAHLRLQSVSSSPLLAVSDEHGSASRLRKAGCQDTAGSLKSL